MHNSKMLARLKQLIRANNAYWLANELGYRSPNTVLNWIENGRIPKIAVDKVTKYLQEK